MAFRKMSGKGGRMTRGQKTTTPLHITGIQKRRQYRKPFKKRKGWRAGYGATKKSYNRWNPHIV